MKNFSDIREDYREDLTEVKADDPPMVLVLRRKAIRIFTNGEKVALYQDQKLGIEVSVPYKPGKFSSGKNTAVSEEVEDLEEGVVHKLHHIAKTKTASDVRFKNGAAGRIEARTALAIVQLHHIMKPENKMKIEKMVNDSPEGLQRVADFAFDNLKI